MKFNRPLNFVLPHFSQLLRRVIFGLKRIFLPFLFFPILFALILPKAGFLQAEASHTKILFNNNGTTSPGNFTVIPNGSQFIVKTVVTNFHDSDGLAAFGVNIILDSNYYWIPNVDPNGIPPAGTVVVEPWITSTGRVTNCDGPFVKNVPNSTNLYKLTFACGTLGSSPLGPQGSGVLLTLKLTPTGDFTQSTTLQIDESELVDTHQDANEVAHTTTASNVQFIKCADLNGDNFVSAPDFFAILGLFGTTPLNTNWNPKADLNYDSSVSAADFFFALATFGRSCS